MRGYQLTQMGAAPLIADPTGDANMQVHFQITFQLLSASPVKQWMTAGPSRAAVLRRESPRNGRGHPVHA